MPDDYPHTRSAARAAGAEYYHGVVCPRGHGTLRRTVSARCEECDKVSRHLLADRRDEERRSALPVPDYTAENLEVRHY